MDGGVGTGEAASSSEGISPWMNGGVGRSYQQQSLYLECGGGRSVGEGLLGDVGAYSPSLWSVGEMEEGLRVPAPLESGGCFPHSMPNHHPPPPSALKIHVHLTSLMGKAAVDSPWEDSAA